MFMYQYACNVLLARQQLHVNPKEHQSTKLKAVDGKAYFHNLAATGAITKNMEVKPYISRDRFP